MIPSTVDRVPRHTSSQVNDDIRDSTEERILQHAAHGGASIEHRLAELDEEWDIERTLEANAATVSLVGCVLGATVDRRWFALPATVAAFLLQHAVQGWCPPLPVFRRLGFRTQFEIEQERYTLKAIRGDFAHVGREQGRNAGERAVAAVQ